MNDFGIEATLINYWSNILRGIFLVGLVVGVIIGIVAGWQLF